MLKKLWWFIPAALWAFGGLAGLIYLDVVRGISEAWPTGALAALWTGIFVFVAAPAIAVYMSELVDKINKLR